MGIKKNQDIDIKALVEAGSAFTGLVAPLVPGILDLFSGLAEQSNERQIQDSNNRMKVKKAKEKNINDSIIAKDKEDDRVYKLKLETEKKQQQVISNSYNQIMADKKYEAMEKQQVIGNNHNEIMADKKYEDVDKQRQSVERMFMKKVDSFNEAMMLQQERYKGKIVLIKEFMKDKYDWYEKSREFIHKEIIRIEEERKNCKGKDWLEYSKLIRGKEEALESIESSFKELELKNSQTINMLEWKMSNEDRRIESQIEALEISKAVEGK